MISALRFILAAMMTLLAWAMLFDNELLLKLFVLPVWALLITLVCGTPLAKAWVTWLTSPAPFHVSSAVARVPTPTLHLGLGSLSSAFELVECTQDESAEQVPGPIWPLSFR